MTNIADNIEAQAATWLARRDAAGEDAEMPEFRAWLDADPRNRAAYLRLAAAWERSARLRMLRPEGSTVDADLFRPDSARKPWIFRRPPLAIAACVLGVAVAVLAWVGISGGEPTYRTEVGGLSRVVLRDGSTVTLNTDTALKVRFTAARREVELLRGEAQFAVVHDPTRPFEVFAGGRVVRAVGTAFDVRLEDGKSVQVLVTQGRVALLDAADLRTLLPIPPGSSATVPAVSVSAGESAFAKGKKVTVQRVSGAEAARHLAWEVGELSFQGETLAEAVAEFNRYNRKKLQVEDSSIARLQIGGNFQALDVDSFVAALGRSFGITATTGDDGSVVLARRATSSHD
jgi:transmembrane sensor